MVEAVVLDETSIDEVTALYAQHAPYGLRSPRNRQWICDRLGTDLFFFGIRAEEELIAAAWAAKKRDLIYFVAENDCLVLKNDGVYVDSGGWFIRPDHQGKGLLQLLTATILTFWFDRIHWGKAPALWGRMMGQKGEEGDPLFWKRVGERITGLPYRELMELPFGAMEEMIWECWPKEPLPFRNIHAEVLTQALGVSFEPLIEPKIRLIQWGFVEITDRYVPTSLNHFMCATEESFRARISDPERFFKEALTRARAKFGGPQL